MGAVRESGETGAAHDLDPDKDAAEQEAAAALAGSEEMLRGLTDALKEGILVLDRNGNVVFWNQGAEKMLGFTEEEVLGRNAVELMAPEDYRDEYHGRFIEFKESRASTGTEDIMEFEAVAKDGRVFPIEIITSMASIKGETDVIVVIRDVTERKETEQALQESKARYRIVEENFTDVVWVSDLDLNIKYANPSAYHQMGYEAEELVSKSLGELMTPESFNLAFARKEEELAIATETAVDPPIPVELEVEQVRKDGTTFWADVRVGFLRRPDGTPYGILGVSRDISGRRHAEEALRTSEERYQLLAENLSDVIWVTDLSLKWTYISPSVVNQTGYSVEEALERNMADTVTPESLKAALSLLEGGMRDELEGRNPPDRIWVVEVEAYRKSGGTIWLEERVKFLRDGDGEPTGILGVARDVTMRKCAEERIKRNLIAEKTVSRISTRLISPQDLEAAINDSLADLGRLMDVGRVYLFEASEDLRYISNTHEWVAEGVTSQISKLQNLAVGAFDEWAEKLLRGEIIAQEDLTVVAKPAGDIVGWKEAKALIYIPMFGRMRLFGFMGLNDVRAPHAWPEEDIRVLRIVSEMLTKAVEQSRTEKALRESENRVRSIAEATGDGILMTTPAGRVLFANTAVERIFGYSYGELECMSVDKLLPGGLEDIVGELMPRLGREEDSTEGKVIEMEGLRRSENTFPAEVSVSLFLLQGQPNVLATVRDITGRKLLAEMEKEAAAAAAAAEVSQQHADELKDIIIITAHELRHPATVFKGYSEILLKYWNEMDNKRIRESLESIGEASNRLTSLVENLLEASLIEKKSIELEYSKVDPVALIEMAVSEARPKAPDGRIRICTSGKYESIEVDSEKIRGVIGILIDNAMKYSPEESLVHIWCEQTGEETLFHVLDRGIGIPEEEREKIFRRFYQVEDVNHHSLPGMGLGLYIARSLVESHGGWIEVFPGEEGGSLFSFGIPKKGRTHSSKAQVNPRYGILSEINFLTP
ncbi:MAG: PAS domain S-box protein [Actinomycetota bacterium]|nr:PAS domain S-box protein [Actinomycetota bacterium]